MIHTGRHSWKIILTPFSGLYGMVIWIRNTLYDNGFFKSTGFNIPLISVGNITVGGTGKTPHVEYLAALLSSHYRVATLSRGYKRKTRDFRLASMDSTVSEIGDEPLQLKNRFPEMTVAVDRKRVNGIKKILDLAPPVEVILMDDAYQHRSVKPGYSILLVDYSRPLDRDLLLPAGMLREPAANLNRANIILVTRTPENIKPIELREYVNRIKRSMGQHIYFTTMQYGELSPVFPGVAGRDAAWFRKNAAGILIVSGIANPQPLRQYAQTIHTNIMELPFADHHQYTPGDIKKIYHTFLHMKRPDQEVLVLTTEKDAMRLRDHSPEPELREAIHAVRINVHFLNDDKDEFDRQILNYVRSNKRSGILHQGEDS
jgi:tetraacyldisaccharide 4'-kinase